MADQLPVALAMMTAGDIRMESVESICAALVTETVSRIFFVQNGPYLDNGRNNMVRVFTEPAVRETCSHLLMVDSDISFAPSDIRALYEACEERAVVSGVYYSVYDNYPRPVVYDWSVNELGLKTMEVIKEWEDGWETWPTTDGKIGGYTAAEKGLDPLVKVEAVGAGFMMIRYEVIDVLEKVFGEPQPWFSEPVVDGIHFGEDLAFCQRVKDSGFSVWCHRDIEVGHFKMTQIGPPSGGRLLQ